MGKYKKHLLILIVEDDVDEYLLLSEIFNGMSATTELNWVKDGEDCLNYLYNKGGYNTDNAPRPDMLLLDLNMPRKNGVEVLQVIKKDKELCRIPVVIFSTSDDQKEVIECYNLGANSFITKPLNYDNYLGVVKTIHDYWCDNAELPE